MWWLIPLAGLLLGVYFGQFLDMEIPLGMVNYLSIGIMAALDSVFGGVKAIYEKKFDSVLMLSGFFTNALLAAALAYIGDMLGLDLYYAAVFAFGVRLFSNLSMIRVHMIADIREKNRLFRERNEAIDLEDEYDDSEEDGEDEDEEDGAEDEERNDDDEDAGENDGDNVSGSGQE